MRRIRNPIGQVSLSAIEDQWQRDATAAAIAAARRGYPGGRSHSAWHTDRPAQRHRVGLDRRRRPVRLDQQARRASGRGADRHRAAHPHDRARPAAMGRRRGGGGSPGPRGCLLRARLVEAAHRLAEGRHHRVSAQGHAAYSQGDDRARPERQGRHPKIQRAEHDRADQSTTRRWRLDDAGPSRRAWV